MVTSTIAPSVASQRVVHMPIAGVVFLALIAVYGTIGNIFIIGAVSLKRKLRVRGNAFVVNLAVADLVICSYIMPLGLVSSQYSEEPFGDGLCNFNAFLLMTSCGVSTQTLMMIGIERYCHVCKMNWYRRFFTPTLIAVYITVIWIYTCIWTCQGLTGWSRFVYGQDVWLCIVDGPYSLSYNLCLSIFGMLIPMILLSFCYFMIFRMVYKTRKRMKSHRNRISAKHGPNSNKSKAEQRKEKKEFKLIIMLFTIVILFCVFWTPAAIVIIFSTEWQSMPEVLYTVAIWMALTNSSMNSVVYGVMNQNFRDGYLAMFNKIFCSCADEDKKLKCTCCKLFRRNSQDDSTSASQSQGTGNANISSGGETSSNAETSSRKKLTASNSTKRNPSKNVVSSNHAGNSKTFENDLTNNNNVNKNIVTVKVADSRPSTAKTVRSINEVTVRSDSKASLRSNTSIGSLIDDEKSMVSIEGPSYGAEELIKALNGSVVTAMESITGEEEGYMKSKHSKRPKSDGSHAKNSHSGAEGTESENPESLYPIQESEV